MKVEIILTIVLMSVTKGERQQRSTVLTDESKRVLNHFDFSSFDKQEALNSLDRQRHENVLRGKRSQIKFKKAHSELANARNQPSDISLKSDERHAVDRKSLKKYDGHDSEIKSTPKRIKHESERASSQSRVTVRNKRGHHLKRNRKHKLSHNQRFRNVYLDENDEEEEEQRRKRKRKKKKKRHYWDRWSEWGPCSVTCGRGRKIRWRKCIVKDCTIGELEMGEKTCQLPACNIITKILGL